MKARVKSCQGNCYKKAIAPEVRGLAQLIRASKSPRTVLIVDQFEEVSTVYQRQRDDRRLWFVGCPETNGDKLSLIKRSHE